MEHAAWLRQARLERGWTEREVAKRVRELCPSGDDCGMDADRLRDFESGLRYPGPAHADALSRLYARTPAQTDESSDPAADGTSGQTEA